MTRPTPAVRLFVEQLEAREVPAARFETLPVLPAEDPAVLEHVRDIAALGRQLGRQADAFLKVGDSNSDSGIFGPSAYLTPLGRPGYDAGASGLAAVRPDLLGTLAAFRADSFTRDSTTAHPGWTIENALPFVRGEIAATNAGVALVMIGTNDLGFFADPERFRNGLRVLVDQLAEAGVVPVLSTLPARLDGFGRPEMVPVYNQVIADVAAEQSVPVWNLARGLAGVPFGGLSADLVHLSVAPAGGGAFGPTDLAFGQNYRNLQALDVLDWFRRTAGAPVPEPVAIPTRAEVPDPVAVPASLPVDVAPVPAAPVPVAVVVPIPVSVVVPPPVAVPLPHFAPSIPVGFVAPVAPPVVFPFAFLTPAAPPIVPPFALLLALATPASVPTAPAATPTAEPADGPDGPALDPSFRFDTTTPDWSSIVGAAPAARPAPVAAVGPDAAVSPVGGEPADSPRTYLVESEEPVARTDDDAPAPEPESHL